MTPITPFDAVLFDCDGVLVDSEVITNRVLCAMLNEAGWVLSAQDCLQLFIGKMVRSQKDLIEARTGKPLTDAWMEAFYARRNAALEQGVKAIDGALAAVQALHAQFNGQIACASGADRKKVEMQLRLTGLLPYFEGRIFSGHEMPRTKPFPDVYLAAAAALGADPKRCLVIEDSVTGTQAGVAAGATVWAYQSPQHAVCPADALTAAGAARLFEHMGDLPQLVAPAGAAAPA